jgi:hypothetical protein
MLVAINISMNKNTKAKGDLAEAAILKQFLIKNYKVLKPFGDNYQYDLVVDDGKGFKKIQCKCTVYNKNQGVLYCLLTRKEYINKKYINVLYKKEDVDYFALYCNELDKTYLIPYKENLGSITLRIDPPKNNQSKGVVYAKEFEF